MRYLTALLIVTLPMTGAADIKALIRKLQMRTHWEYVLPDGTTESMQGNFAGLVNDHVQVEDYDGFKRRIPVSALVDPVPYVPQAPRISLSTIDESDYAMVDDYRAQVKGRRTNAQYVKANRYQQWRAAGGTYNRPPTVIPYDPIGVSAIQRGLIRQPYYPSCSCSPQRADIVIYADISIN